MEGAPPPRVYINRIGTAVPDYDVHAKFVDFAPRLLSSEASRRLFKRMAERSQIEHRYSCLRPHSAPERLDQHGFYRPGAFPSTGERMHFFEAHAFELAARALENMDIGGVRSDITHLMLVTCTGFYAPGVDLQIIDRCGLDPAVERTTIGFMGCHAAINALKLARHIVRSEPDARVLVLNLELCTLHLQDTDDLEEILSFLIFADGCTASLISAEPAELELCDFYSSVLPHSAQQVTWRIGDHGYLMNLSGQVPQTVASALPQTIETMLHGRPSAEIIHWALHPGGRSVLDAAEYALGLNDGALEHSREILRRYGNMSSATVMFVLEALLQSEPRSGLGCAMAFGPGVSAEGLLFQVA